MIKRFVTDVNSMTKKAFQGDSSKELKLMKISDMDMIFNKPEGYFDSLKRDVEDDKNLWAPIHRLVIESNDIENYIIKQYARGMQKKTILKDINQEFTLGKRL